MQQAALGQVQKAQQALKKRQRVPPHCIAPLLAPQLLQASQVQATQAQVSQPEELQQQQGSQASPLHGLQLLQAQALLSQGQHHLWCQL